MKSALSISLFTMTATFLFGRGLPAGYAEGVASSKLTRYVIEDGESRDPAKYYDERPPVLEQTYDRATQGSRSIHFVTGTGPGSGYITRYVWPEAQDFSEIAKMGVVSFDLWIRNPGDLYQPNVGRKFGFSLGSRSNDRFVEWYVGASLLKPETWNGVALRIENGKAILTGSSVNGLILSRDPESSVANGAIDWKKVNYSKLSLHVSNAPVEGYLDNVVVEVFDLSSRPHKSLMLSSEDPTSHLREALEEAKPNKPWPKYDFLPPDVRQDAFFDDDLLRWDRSPRWKADFYEGENEVFCLSMDQALRGKRNAKIEMKAVGQNPRVILAPLEPIRIDRDFDVIDCWVYGRYHYGTTLGISFRLKDGSPYKWTGGTNSYLSPGLLFSDWTLAHIVLPKRIERGAELVALEFSPPAPGEYLFHIDQLRVLNFKDYLAAKPAPNFKNTGPVVKLPVDPSGACPQTVEPVKTSVSLEGGKGVLRYVTETGEEARYVYTPRTGTLSDLTVEVQGKSPFRPAEGSGPVFDDAGRLVSAPAADCKTECLAQKVVKGALFYEWRYTTPGGTTTIDYRFLLKGKTLVVEATSREAKVCNWLFGHASGLRDARVIEMPFMIYSPNMLCTEGLFVTYYADWYRSNASVVPYEGSNTVSGDTAAYSYRDPGYAYWPRTDGARYPFKECFYITASSRFEDCLLTISNPPSPHKQVLSQRLYRMVSPGADWVDITRATVDLYDRYGMTNLFFMFHAGLWSNRGGRGPEPWHTRMTVSIATKGGDEGVIDLFSHMREKGVYPGYYGGFSFFEPISRVWDYDNVALLPKGDWWATWVQAYHMKPWLFPELANTFSREQAKKFGVRTVYEDGWTANAPFEQNDYDHRCPGSGRMIDSLTAMATGYRNLRAAVKGPVFSEGCGRDYYSAGLNDGDYGKLKGFANGKSPEENRVELLVDFALRKVNPLHPVVSVNIGYWGYAASNLYGGGYRYLHHFLATQIAFGTIGMLEPYSVLYPDPRQQLDVTLTSYFMMQQMQKRYIMEPVEEIKYFDGERLVPTSEAVLTGKYKDNMVQIRYRNGLVIYVNANWDKKSWVVKDEGQRHDLPPGGWFARQGRSFIEYSATVEGTRVDFVDSPDYTYINAHGRTITLAGLTTDKILIRHKAGKHKGQTLSYPE